MHLFLLQKWRHFPDSWVEEGEFVTSDIDPFQVSYHKEISEWENVFVPIWGFIHMW